MTYGTTFINSADGQWFPIKGLWYRTNTGWVPVKSGWIRKDDGTWERIYPTPQGILSAAGSVSFSTYIGRSQTQGITITNTGDIDLIISSSTKTDGSRFTILTSGTFPATLSPGQSTTYNITVYGTSVGSASGSVTFYYSTGAVGLRSTTIQINTDVQDLYSAISVSPGSVSASYSVGDSAPRYTVTMYNSGNDTLRISSITTTDSAVAGLSALTYTVSPGGTNTFNIDINGSRDMGSYSATITINSDARDRPTLTIPVSLSVRDAGIISASPSSVSASYVEYGSTPAITLSVTNSGKVGLDISGVSTTGGFVSVTGVPYYIPPYTTNSDARVLLPSGYAAGSYSGSIIINSNAKNNNSLNIPVQLSVATNAILEPSRASVSFSYNAGGSASAETILLRNSGTSNFTVSSVSSDSLTVNVVGGPTVAPGATISLQITPTKTIEGSYSEIVTIYSTANNSPTQIRVSTTILGVHGQAVYTTPGTYLWQVPAGVQTAIITIVGAGGGGGGSTEVGNGGGGGGGGSGAVEHGTYTVTAGSYFGIVVGAGGAGSPYVGRDAGFGGGGGTASFGGASAVSGPPVTLGVTGGYGGSSGAYNVGGSGGAGGMPAGSNGLAGTNGENDYSTTYGGPGGRNWTGYGTGGAGADAPDRVPPYNWGGNPGQDGAVIITW